MEKKEKYRNSYSELPEGEEVSSPAKVTPKESLKAKGSREFQKKRILKKSKSIKEKNDPERFSGEGINFRAKIIGIEDVFDARGNRMCQGALQKLKAAVKTSGDHKQRIILNISLEGIIIKDEKSGEVLHHHPIHKISCISQDTKDSRAFGFVYGCPQTGHRFFAIKTEKAAAQVVVTLRDLFLVALEIKKKEIEKAHQEEEEEGNNEEQPPESVNKSETNNASCNGLSNGNTTASDFFASAFENGSGNQRINHDLLYSNTVLLPEEPVPAEKVESSNHTTEPEPEAAVDTLLDLQSEVSILQQGISQLDQTIAHAVSQSLGISFSEDEISESSASSVPTTTVLQFKLDKLSSLYHETMSISSRSSSTSDYNVCVNENRQEEVDTPRKEPVAPDLPALLVESGRSSSGGAVSSLSISGSVSETNSTSAVEDKYAVFLDIDSLPSIFDDPSIVKVPEVVEKVPPPVVTDDKTYEREPSPIPQEHCEVSEECSEAKSSTPVPFAELDPLSSQPYVDRRDFFQDIKNPPKRVLKDLAGGVHGTFHSSSDGDAFSNSQECLNFSDFKFSSLEEGEGNPLPPHPEGGMLPPLGNPPRLPPKRAAAFPAAPEIFHQENGHSAAWEPKNPFNPFLGQEYPDVLPPSSPPPPPPRLPTKLSESPPCCTSSPPPRPPSRVNCINVPTPPLPKRKVPLITAHRTWFSFDQDVTSFPPATPPPVPVYSSFAPVIDDVIAPPLPSPARKLFSPPSPNKPESPLPKSSSASNSPATVRRLHGKSSFLGNTVVIKEDSGYSNSSGGGENKTDIVAVSSATSSPRRLLSRHSSILEDGEFSSSLSGATFNPFLESVSESPRKLPEGDGHAECSSPPLPPKPPSICQPRPSPAKVLCSSSASSSGVPESSGGGTHSSSSLVFSSSDDSRRLGSSSEALFADSSQTDVFVQQPEETTLHSQQQSSTSNNNGIVATEEAEDSDRSPDSIFRRKSDPFADDFFLTLHRKKAGDGSGRTLTPHQSVAEESSTEVPFENLKAPT